MNSWPSSLNTTPNLFKIFLAWGSISGPSNNFKLSYNRSLLDSPLAHIWLSLYDRIRIGSNSGEFRLAMTFILPVLAYSLPHDLHLLPTVLAIASTSEFRSLIPPPHASYDLTQGFKPERKELIKSAINCAYPLRYTPSNNLTQSYEENPSAFDKRKDLHYERACDTEARALVDEVLSQWPCAKPNQPTRNNTHINLNEWMEEVRDRFRDCYHNVELHEFIQKVQGNLDGVRQSDTTTAPTTTPTYTFSSAAVSSLSDNCSVRIAELLRREPPSLWGSLEVTQISNFYSESHEAGNQTLWTVLNNFRLSTHTDEPLRRLLTVQHSLRSANASSPYTESRKVGAQTLWSPLRSLLEEFKSSKSTVEQLYGKGLEESYDTFEKQTKPIYSQQCPFSQQTLIQYRQSCYDRVQNMIAKIRSILYPTTSVEKVVLVAGQWPRISVRTVLEMLGGDSATKLAPPWKEALSLVAQEMIRYQRSQRILAHAECGHVEELYKELYSDDSSILDAMQHPEWLLIQVGAQSL